MKWRQQGLHDGNRAGERASKRRACPPPPPHAHQQVQHPSAVLSPRQPPRVLVHHLLSGEADLAHADLGGGRGEQQTKRLSGGGWEEEHVTNYDGRAPCIWHELPACLLACCSATTWQARGGTHLAGLQVWAGAEQLSCAGAGAQQKPRRLGWWWWWVVGWVCVCVCVWGGGGGGGQGRRLGGGSSKVIKQPRRLHASAGGRGRQAHAPAGRRRVCEAGRQGGCQNPRSSHPGHLAGWDGQRANERHELLAGHGGSHNEARRQARRRHAALRRAPRQRRRGRAQRLRAPRLRPVQLPPPEGVAAERGRRLRAGAGGGGGGGGGATGGGEGEGVVCWAGRQGGAAAGRAGREQLEHLCCQAASPHLSTRLRPSPRKLKPPARGAAAAGAAAAGLLLLLQLPDMWRQVARCGQHSVRQRLQVEALQLLQRRRGCRRRRPPALLLQLGLLDRLLRRRRRRLRRRLLCLLRLLGGQGGRAAGSRGLWARPGAVAAAGTAVAAQLPLQAFPKATAVLVAALVVVFLLSIILAAVLIPPGCSLPLLCSLWSSRLPPLAPGSLPRRLPLPAGLRLPLPAWGADLALAVAPDGAALVALADSRHGGALSLLRCDSLAASGWEELGSGVSVGAALAIRLALRPGGAGGDVLAAWMDDAEGLGAAEYGAASGTWRQQGAAPSVAADWVPLEGAPRGSPEGRCRCAIERPGCGGGGQLTCQTHGPHHDCKQAYHLPPSPPSILLQAAWRWVWGQRVHPLWRWHVTRQTLRAAWSACCSTTAAAGRWQAATQPRTAACCRWRASQACPR